LIDPVVRFLQRRSLFFKNLRGPHVVGAYLAFFIAAALTVQGLAPLVSSPVNTFLKESPAWLDTVTTGDIAVTIGNARGWNELEELRLKAFPVDHREKIHPSFRVHLGSKTRLFCGSFACLIGVRATESMGLRV
jgi:predicted PurR-regulated permease PerM